jgi:hypothetical protein
MCRFADASVQPLLKKYSDFQKAQITFISPPSRPTWECRVIPAARSEYSCAYLLPMRTRGCGCIGRLAFPTPSSFQGGKFEQTSGASRRENAKGCSSLRANARPMTASAMNQSTLSFRCSMDCFAEPVIGQRFAPARWLAMTARRKEPGTPARARD